jgi:hypothetical protein
VSIFPVFKPIPVVSIQGVSGRRLEADHRCQK